VNTLSRYNKRLDDEQMKLLLSKKGSANPLWLSLACEELRVYGVFKMVNEKIQSLSDDLLRYNSLKRWLLFHKLFFQEVQ
jgi:hypothetical protein